MKTSLSILTLLALLTASAFAQSQTNAQRSTPNAQPPAAPKPSEGRSTLNSPSAIAQRAPADQLSSTNHVLDLDGSGSYVELPPNIFNDFEIELRQ